MIDIEIEDAAWGEASPQAEALVRRAADAAARAVEGDVSVVILLTDDASVRELNARYRDKDYATNVLSFPAPENPEGLLGDICLAFGVCAREAQEQGKTLEDHLQHLVVHGVLHLLGYDHESEAEADEMESLESVVLAGLGIADPYVLTGEGDHDRSRPL